MITADAPYILSERYSSYDREFMRLVTAVFAQAVKDAACPKVAQWQNAKNLQAEAREWLVSLEGREYALNIGIDPSRVEEWIRDNCPMEGISLKGGK